MCVWSYVKSPDVLFRKYTRMLCAFCLLQKVPLHFSRAVYQQIPDVTCVWPYVKSPAAFFTEVHPYIMCVWSSAKSPAESFRQCTRKFLMLCAFGLLSADYVNQHRQKYHYTDQYLLPLYRQPHREQSGLQHRNHEHSQNCP